MSSPYNLPKKRGKSGADECVKNPSVRFAALEPKAVK